MANWHCCAIDRTEPDGKQSIVFGDEAKMMDCIGDLVNTK
jgi:hypothetical protein